jgi:hypothetical protein
MSNQKNYFGFPDAVTENIKLLKPNHLERRIDESIKAYNRKEGDQIIVGIKGSGKTDIRRFIEANENAYIFNLDADNAYLVIDANKLTGHSGRIKSTIALEIVRAFASFIGSSDKGRGKAKELLDKAASKALDILKNIPDAVDLETPIGKVNLSKLVGSDSAKIVYAAWKTVISDVTKALKTKHGYIMIDDAEDVFPGIENSPDFLEGVARAVHDINKEGSKLLHVLLFLKYGIWRHWFENQREYDKVDHVIAFLSWDHDSLCEIIARRIARRHGILNNRDGKNIDIEELWKKEFSIKKQKDFQELSHHITRYCVNGPRDMIKICNMAKELAGDNIIEYGHINDVLKTYSEKKIFELNADFGDVYPKVHKFVDRVFRGVKKELKGKDVAEWIEDNAMLEDKIDDQFSSCPWYKDSSKEKLVAVMYEIGFIGKKHANGLVKYSIEQPKEIIGDLIDSDLVIHPAFHPYLGIK